MGRLSGIFGGGQDKGSGAGKGAGSDRDYPHKDWGEARDEAINREIDKINREIDTGKWNDSDWGNYGTDEAGGGGNFVP